MTLLIGWSVGAYNVPYHNTVEWCIVLFIILARNHKVHTPQRNLTGHILVLGQTSAVNWKFNMVGKFRNVSDHLFGNFWNVSHRFNVSGKKHIPITNALPRIPKYADALLYYKDYEPIVIDKLLLPTVRRRTWPVRTSSSPSPVEQPATSLISRRRRGEPPLLPPSQRHPGLGGPPGNLLFQLAPSMG